MSNENEGQKEFEMQIMTIDKLMEKLAGGSDEWVSNFNDLFTHPEFMTEALTFSMMAIRSLMDDFEKAMGDKNYHRAIVALREIHQLMDIWGQGIFCAVFHHDRDEAYKTSDDEVFNDEEEYFVKLKDMWMRLDDVVAAEKKEGE